MSERDNLRCMGLGGWVVAGRCNSRQPRREGDLTPRSVGLTFEVSFEQDRR